MVLGEFLMKYLLIIIFLTICFCAQPWECRSHKVGIIKDFEIIIGGFGKDTQHVITLKDGRKFSTEYFIGRISTNKTLFQTIESGQYFAGVFYVK